MAKLADALASGASSCKTVQVQVLLSAPKQYNPNHFTIIGDAFGFVVSYDEFIVKGKGV